MHGCYLYWKDLNVQEKNELPGVSKKILDQIAAINASGIGCDFVYYKRAESKLIKAATCLPFMPDGNAWPSAEILSQYDFAYIRRPRYISKELLALMIKTHVLNPGFKAILEYPTYPVEKHVSQNPLLGLALAKEQRSLLRLGNSFDAVSMIFGVEPEKLDLSGFSNVEILRLYNGIDINRITPRRPSAQDDGILHVCCAAYYTDWHGTDRFIKGMADYYSNGGTQEILLHVAGIGPVVNALKALVSSYALDAHVVFYGYCGGSELDAIYNTCTFAIESLGIHRCGRNVSTTLKSVEYLAKGIPFVYTGSLVFPGGEMPQWCLQVPQNEEPINIEEIIQFHNSLYEIQQQEELIREMRGFAERNVSIEAAFANVLNYLHRFS